MLLNQIIANQVETRIHRASACRACNEWPNTLTCEVIHNFNSNSNSTLKNKVKVNSTHTLMRCTIVWIQCYETDYHCGSQYGFRCQCKQEIQYIVHVVDVTALTRERCVQFLYTLFQLQSVHLPVTLQVDIITTNQLHIQRCTDTKCILIDVILSFICQLIYTLFHAV